MKKIIEFFKNLFRCNTVTCSSANQEQCPDPVCTIIEEPKVVEHPAPTQVKVVQKKRKRCRPRKNKQNN